MIVPSLSLSAHTREGFRVFRVSFGLFMFQFLVVFQFIFVV